MNSGRQARGPFYAYVGWGSLLILMIGKLLVLQCWFPAWILAASDDSSFCLLWGALLQLLGPPLQVLYVVFISLVETESL